MVNNTSILRKRAVIHAVNAYLVVDRDIELEVRASMEELRPRIQRRKSMDVRPTRNIAKQNPTRRLTIDSRREQLHPTEFVDANQAQQSNDITSDDEDIVFENIEFLEDSIHESEEQTDEDNSRQQYLKRANTESSLAGSDDITTYKNMDIIIQSDSSDEGISEERIDGVDSHQLQMDNGDINDVANGATKGFESDIENESHSDNEFVSKKRRTDDGNRLQQTKNDLVVNQNQDDIERSAHNSESEMENLSYSHDESISGEEISDDNMNEEIQIDNDYHQDQYPNVLITDDEDEDIFFDSLDNLDVEEKIHDSGEFFY